jgi:hypothetical protein
MSVFKKLDSEHLGRIQEISNAWWNGKGFEIKDVFHSAAVIPSLAQQKVILGSFRLSTIYANYPFSKKIFVLLCPSCLKPEEFPILREVLAHSDIIPILVGNYSDYHPDVARIVLEHPHISRHEFYFFRFIRVYTMGEKVVCSHCIEEQKKMILQDLRQTHFNKVAEKLVQRCVENLHPHSGQLSWMWRINGFRNWSKIWHKQTTSDRQTEIDS